MACAADTALSTTDREENIAEIGTITKCTEKEPFITLMAASPIREIGVTTPSKVRASSTTKDRSNWMKHTITQISTNLRSAGYTMREISTTTTNGAAGCSSSATGNASRAASKTISSTAAACSTPWTAKESSATGQRTS